MKIKHIIIKKSSPLKNLDIEFSPVTLIVGDNERGKTRLLHWIARGLFEKPHSQGEEVWSSHIGGEGNVQIDVDSFYPYYDGDRMKNLLFIQEGDLLFKYHSQESLAPQEYWNEKINGVLYGSDEISLLLKNNFFRAMGVGQSKKTSWLMDLHESLLDIKNTMEDLLPEVEMLNSKVYGLHQINHSLGDIKDIERDFESQEELYEAVEKVRIAQKYFDLLRQQQEFLQIQEDEQSIETQQEEIRQHLKENDDTIIDLDDKVDDLKLDLAKLEQEEKEVQEDPYATFSESWFKSLVEACLGVIMLATGGFFAFQTMTERVFSLTKGAALICFVIGFFYMIRIIFKSFYIQQLSTSTGENPNIFHQYKIKKTQKDFARKDKELDTVRKESLQLQQSNTQSRKKLKDLTLQVELLKKEQRKITLDERTLRKLEKDLFALYSNNDLHEIQNHMERIYERIENQYETLDFQEIKKMRTQKKELLSQKNTLAQEYEKRKSLVVGTMKNCIESLSKLENNEMIDHFYPEVSHLYLRNVEVGSFQETLNTLETILDQVSKDRYRSEKIVNIYNAVESQSENLLEKTLKSEFFEFLVQNIFGGKYKTFKADYDAHYNIKIYAETGHGDLAPLDSLSSSTYAQLWFILRLSLARTVLGKDPGVILLDDSFNTFDIMRKRTFIEVLNALVHDGWQIIYTMTHDELIASQFQELFGEVLTVVDLNHDYD